MYHSYSASLLGMLSASWILWLVDLMCSEQLLDTALNPIARDSFIVIKVHVIMYIQCLCLNFIIVQSTLTFSAD